jgi:hydrogenase nickel incorporation protein HypA/HybF
MHEMSLAEGVLQVVEDAAQARPVRLVRLEIGALAAVELQALRFAFDVVKHGSVAAGAALDILATPGEAWCMHCCTSVPIAARGDACPTCGSHQLQVTGGDAMRVKELELV